MHIVHTIAVASTPDVVYRLATDVEDWPRILPHYRYVRVLERQGPNECIVDMGAKRGQLPVWWRSKMWGYPDEHRIVFKHIAGATRRMDVEWAITSISGVTRIRLTHDIELPYPVLGPIIAWVMCDTFVSYIANETLPCIAAAAEGRALLATG